MVQSKKYKLNKDDGKKIAKGAAIAFGGFLLTYALDLIPQIDWGSYETLVIPMSAVLINFLLKVIQGK